MACDEPLARGNARRDKVICGKPECKRYYHALYDAQPAVQAARKQYMHDYYRRERED